jgi:F-type H+-transporting ATPase subunit b
MMSDPKFWVAVSFFIFVALAYKKLAVFTTRSLDDRSARIRHDLDEARRLREEAESVLAQYKQKQAEWISA